jgi:hypothetical protein
MWGAVLGAFMLTAASSWAGDDEDRARVLFKEGVELLQKGEFEPALHRFEGAYESWRNPKILLNIATTLRQLGRLPEAGDMYELYLADPGADPKKNDEVKTALSEIDAKIGLVTIEVGVDGVTVAIDGTRLERSKSPSTKELVRSLPLAEDVAGRWRVRLMPGKHTVEATKDGYEPRTVELALSAGESKTLELALAVESEAPPPPPPPSPAPPPPPPEDELSHKGQIVLVTRADVDGKFRGAVGVLGAGYGLGAVVELQAAALVGRDKGFEPGASFYLSEGMFKPVGYVGVPVFLVDGASPGLHGAVGLQVDPSKNFGGFVQVGVATFFNVPEDRESTAFVPSVGIQGRM